MDETDERRDCLFLPPIRYSAARLQAPLPEQVGLCRQICLLPISFSPSFGANILREEAATWYANHHPTPPPIKHGYVFPTENSSYDGNKFSVRSFGLSLKESLQKFQLFHRKPDVFHTVWDYTYYTIYYDYKYM